MIAEMIIEKSSQLCIDLNSKSSGGFTPFHFACKKGKSMVVEVIMKKSIDFNINLNAKDHLGKTAFHLVCENR